MMPRGRERASSSVRRRATGPLLLITLLAAGCATCRVARVNGGRVSCGREVDSRAYAAYARGQLSELQGDRASAAREYEHAIDLDSRAARAWIRLGALRCRTAPARAEAAWRHALRLAADSYLLWYERARCALDQGALGAADQFSRRALALGPSLPEVTLLAARVASRLGDSERESTLLFGALATQPGNAVLWTALATSPTVPASLQEHALRRLLELRPIDASWIPPAYLKAQRADPLQQQIARHLRTQLELALARRDSHSAVRLAGLLGVRPRQLALSALDAGFHAFALQQARVLLALDTNDVFAWLIAACAAVLSQSHAAVVELLSHPPEAPDPLRSAVSSAALGKAVSRRVKQ